MIIAAVVRIAIELLFSTHLYTFGGKIFKQKEGGPIGLRATCAVARLIMNMWGKKWLSLMKEWNLDIEEYVRYMDDGRVFIHSIKRGWRWEEGELVWMEEWEVEDAGVRLKEVTKRVVNKSMQEVLPFLNITTEIGEDFEDGWLPTLDISLKVDEREQVLWKIYEKPTASKVTVQSRSVMGGGCCNIVPRDIVPRDIVPRNIVPRDFVRRKHCSKDNIVQRTTLFQGGKNMY